MYQIKRRKLFLQLNDFENDCLLFHNSFRHSCCVAQSVTGRVNKIQPIYDYKGYLRTIIKSLLRFVSFEQIYLGISNPQALFKNLLSFYKWDTRQFSLGLFFLWLGYIYQTSYCFSQFFLLSCNGYFVFDPKYMCCRDLFSRNESVFLCF